VYTEAGCTIKLLRMARQRYGVPIDHNRLPRRDTIDDRRFAGASRFLQRGGPRSRLRGLVLRRGVAVGPVPAGRHFLLYTAVIGWPT